MSGDFFGVFVKVDDYPHAGTFVELVSSLILAFDSKTNPGETTRFKSTEGILEEHAPKTSTAAVGADSKLAHPTKVWVFEAERTSDELIFRF